MRIIRPSQKRMIVEAGIAVGVLAVLLFFTFPRFMAAQKQGSITSWKTEMVVGNWQWKNEILTQSSDDEPAFILFSPRIEKGELSFSAHVEKGRKGIGVVFGYNLNKLHCWNMGSLTDRPYLEVWGTSTFLQNLKKEMLPPSKDLVYLDQINYMVEEWHDIRLVVNSISRRVEGYVNGEMVLHESLDSSVSGQFGLYTWKAKTEFKNIKVTDNNGLIR